MRGLGVTVALLWLAMPVAAFQTHPVFGAWTCSQYGIQVTLNPDFTYTFVHASGTSVGRYWFGGNVIYLQDSASGMITPYGASLTDDVLQFVDAKGVAMIFARSSSAPVPQVTVGSGAVLAQKDGFRLTQGDVDAGIDILQFIIDGRLTDQERSDMTQQAVREFSASPKTYLDDLRSLADSRARLGQIRDPLQVGMLRQALLVAFHTAGQKVAAADLPLFVRIMNSYVRVLAFDEKNQLALTNKDLNAYFDYTSFLFQLNTGQSFVWPAPDREKATSDIVGRFASMPLQEKQFYCAMGIIWEYFQYAWKQAEAAQRAQMAQQMFAGARGLAPSPNLNYGSTLPVASIPSATGREMDDSTYNTLRNVMLMDHAATMNAWSHVGDSPYYYEVVDY